MSSDVIPLASAIQNVAEGRKAILEAGVAYSLELRRSLVLRDLSYRKLEDLNFPMRRLQKQNKVYREDTVTSLEQARRVVAADEKLTVLTMIISSRTGFETLWRHGVTMDADASELQQRLAILEGPEDELCEQLSPLKEMPCFGNTEVQGNAVLTELKGIEAFRGADLRDALEIQSAARRRWESSGLSAVTRADFDGVMQQLEKLTTSVHDTGNRQRKLQESLWELMDKAKTVPKLKDGISVDRLLKTNADATEFIERTEKYRKLSEQGRTTLNWGAAYARGDGHEKFDVRLGVKGPVHFLQYDADVSCLAAAIGPEVHVTKEQDKDMYTGGLRLASPPPLAAAASTSRDDDEERDTRLRVTGIHFSRKGRVIIVSYVAHGIIQARATLARRSTEDAPMIASSALSPDCKQLMAYHLQKGLRRYTVTTYFAKHSRCKYEFDEQQTSRLSLQMSFLHGGKAIVCGTTTGKVCIWDVETGELYQKLPHDTDTVQAVAAHQTGAFSYIATGSSGTGQRTYIKIWRARNNERTEGTSPDGPMAEAFDVLTFNRIFVFSDDQRRAVLFTTTFLASSWSPGCCTTLVFPFPGNLSFGTAGIGAPSISINL
ncbi:uncharacterized protein B0H18DRAFT_1121803 [Fomitopsis serialis]|uniref:uncharacterized protein n=1 Tax=Fomitopsis serialis TaxID=139415 RepID=UPI00200898D0|nr:uncharacterized protein B0H18DRAFT_1121803 [Neoantrodia serialis]KAH9920711.1 hypothetical protein B0H18DRAFT_1121803 [Neoantrodia serialis]